MLKASPRKGLESKGHFQKQEPEEQPLDSETRDTCLDPVGPGLLLGSEWDTVRQRNYEPIKILGKGSFGTVVQAKDTITGSIVAIKHIKVDITKRNKLISLCRELAILEFLTRCMSVQNLPNLFTGYEEVFCTNSEVDLQSLSNLFVVMKASKHSLREFIQGFDISDNGFKRVMYNILCAVHILHSSNIIHRDIKPENILFSYV